MIITVNVSYQKDVFFYFTLGEPHRITCTTFKKNFFYRILTFCDSGEGDTDPDRVLQELNSRNLITSRQRVAMQGRAQLGDIPTTVIRLQENKAFKVRFNHTVH